MNPNDRASQPVYELPPGVVHRLTDHYGPNITSWLRSAPALIVQAAVGHRLYFRLIRVFRG